MSSDSRTKVDVNDLSVIFIVAANVATKRSFRWPNAACFRKVMSKVNELHVDDRIIILFFLAGCCGFWHP